MSYVIGRGRYAREAYPTPNRSAGRSTVPASPIEVVSDGGSDFAQTIDLALGGTGMPAPSTFTPTLTGHVRVTVQASVNGSEGDAIAWLPLRDGTPIGTFTPQTGLISARFTEVSGITTVVCVFTDQVAPDTAHSWGIRVSDLADPGTNRIQTSSGGVDIIVEEFSS